MGYLVAIGVIGFWAWIFSAKRPEQFLLFFIGGCLIIGLIWLRNYNNEIKQKKFRDERERARIKSIRDDFQNLHLQIVTNKDQHPFAFRSLFDATRSFAGKPYSFPEIKDLFFVVNGIVTTAHEVEIITSFLSEFYDIYGDSSSVKKPIYVIDESQDSRDEKERLSKEREIQRQRILEIALADIDGRTKEDVGQEGSALYIMASKLGVKVGISDEPQNRLGQVQTGHPATISLSKVIWFFSRQDAVLVEKTVHDLLKLQNAHVSGEWFNLKSSEASDVVGKVVRDLIQKGEVDAHRRETHSKNIETDLDLTLARLISLPWKISHKGNEWLKLRDKNITIFPKRSRWCFVCDGEFSAGTFDTKKEAKVAALQLYLERFGDLTVT